MLNRKGYTIVEGIIAMLLVAVMVGGIFSALMASRRAIVEPSRKEEMLYAIESLENNLKNCVSSRLDEDCSIDNCGGGSDAISIGEHNCTLPDVCKGADDYFKYEVSGTSISDPYSSTTSTLNQIKISMKCNGEAL